MEWRSYTLSYLALLDLLLIQPLAFAKFVGQMDYLLNKVSLLTAVLRVTLYNGVVITELMKVPRQRDVLLHALEQGLSHSFRFGLCVPSIRTDCLICGQLYSHAPRNPRVTC